VCGTSEEAVQQSWSSGSIAVARLAAHHFGGFACEQRLSRVPTLIADQSQGFQLYDFEGLVASDLSGIIFRRNPDGFGYAVFPAPAVAGVPEDVLDRLPGPATACSALRRQGHRRIGVQASDNFDHRQTVGHKPLEDFSHDIRGGIVDDKGTTRPTFSGQRPRSDLAPIAERNRSEDERFIDQPFVAGSDVVDVHADDEFVHHGVHVQERSPAFGVCGIDSRLDEERANAAFDHLFFHELQRAIAFAKEPIGGKEEDHFDGLGVETGSQGVQLVAVIFVPPNAHVKEDELGRDVDFFLTGFFEQGADLIDDRILMARGIAGVNGPEIFGQFAGQSLVIVRHELSDLFLDPDQFGVGILGRGRGRLRNRLRHPKDADKD